MVTGKQNICYPINRFDRSFKLSLSYSCNIYKYSISRLRFGKIHSTYLTLVSRSDEQRTLEYSSPFETKQEYSPYHTTTRLSLPAVNRTTPRCRNQFISFFFICFCFQPSLVTTTCSLERLVTSRIHLGVLCTPLCRRGYFILAKGSPNQAHQCRRVSEEHPSGLQLLQPSYLKHIKSTLNQQQEKRAIAGPLGSSECFASV